MLYRLWLKTQAAVDKESMTVTPVQPNMPDWQEESYWRQNTPGERTWYGQSG